MPDWTKSMRQTFEYYIVDPGTWRDAKAVENVESCQITRDAEVDTLGSSSIVTEDDFSDKYIRTYLVTEQGGVREKFALGTHLYQSPSTEYTSNRHSSSQDGYTPLIELSENPPPFGYSLSKGTVILDMAAKLIREHARCPLIDGNSVDQLADNFVSNTDDTWLTFLSDMIANAKYSFGLDPMGNILFEKRQDTDALQPVWTYTDDNSSILYPSLTISRDLYGIPNVVEVIYSPSDGNPIFAEVVNDDPASPVSTVNRGRRVTHRETNPDVVEGVNEAQLKDYAKNLMKEMSSLEYTVTYKHGYCPVRLNDCVLLNYNKAGIRNVKARVIRQVIDCSSGCSVEETAIFSKQLWG